MKYLMVVFFLTLQLVACSTSHPTRIIDAHTHTHFDGMPEKGSGILNTQEQYYRELNENNVKGAVSMNSRNGGGLLIDTEHHIVNCAGIGIPVDYKKVEDGIKEKKYRCIKIYLGYVHAYVGDQAYLPLYRLAEKYKIPVVFHTGDTYSIKGKLKFSDPLTVDEIAVDFPNVNFVIAHIGNPWIQTAAEVAYKNPNVYLDGSALLIGNLTHYSKEDLQKYVIEPLQYVSGYVEDPKKLMFATDWPLASMKDYISVFKQAIPKENWDDVFYKNARRVFQMNDLPE
jgi:hypothetical protein